MEYKKVVVAGGGILGSQIAFQSAYSGFDVTILVRKEDAKRGVRAKLEKLRDTYLDMIKLMEKKEDWANGIATGDNFNPKECEKAVLKAYDEIKIVHVQEEALTDADLVIESVTENLELKREFYKQIAGILPEKTVLVTNSSTLLPSKLADATGRSEKFLSLHFANSIWKHNTAEVMGHPGTDKKYFDELIEYAKAIHMIPLPVREEKAGYLLNSLLVPFLLSAMDLLANGVSDPETIDKAWTLGTGAPNGPFKILDTVGLITAKNIIEQYQKVPGLLSPLLKKMMLPYNYKKMLEMINKYIDEGKLGKSTGEGFYKYK
ncbi:MAG: 3-hydroxyacyl-CoA dehydrogenase [Bacilli bacterium]|nr:3-hydroxyacyl-CoA dehydrogenase [Bacilli bacterium]